MALTLSESLTQFLRRLGEQKNKDKSGSPFCRLQTATTKFVELIFED